MSTGCSIERTSAEGWGPPTAVAAGFREVDSFSFGVMSARAAARASFRDFRDSPLARGELSHRARGVRIESALFRRRLVLIIARVWAKDCTGEGADESCVDGIEDTACLRASLVARMLLVRSCT